ncbi:MAG: hypothetical protein QM759_15345 [Terricaulis sp.]
MKKSILAAVALAAATCSVAYADEPSDWVKCDGYARPEGAGVTAARILAVITTMGLFGLPETARSAPAATGQAGVDACTRALDTHEADRFWGRHVAMLQARTVHNAEADHLDAALEDLHGAGTIAEAQAPGPWYSRSLGVSAMLLEAAIDAKRGDQQHAEELAELAFEARPYSSTVGLLSTVIFEIDPAMNDKERHLLDQVVALNPSLREVRAQAYDWSDDAAGAADVHEHDLAYEQALVDAGQRAALSLETIARASVSAYRAHRDARGKELADQLRQLLAQPISQMLQTPTTQEVLQDQQQLAKERVQAQRFLPLIEAYERMRAGDARGAFSTLAAGQVPDGGATYDLMVEIAHAHEFAAISAQLTQSLATMRADDHTRRMGAIQIASYSQALPPLEQVGGGNHFGGRGWGANGYSDRALARGGSGRTIEFSGGTTITTTEELALLRAAQLSLSNHSTGFVVINRCDYQRYYVTRQYNVETSRTPSGFQTQTDVLYVDGDAPPAAYAGAVLPADEIFNSLSPIYNPPRNGH